MIQFRGTVVMTQFFPKKYCGTFLCKGSVKDVEETDSESRKEAATELLHSKCVQALRNPRLDP